MISSMNFEVTTLDDRPLKAAEKIAVQSNRAGLVTGHDLSRAEICNKIKAGLEPLNQTLNHHGF
jgi:hypothetical protein